MNIRIATRKSPLALWQAEYVKTQILKHHPKINCTLIPITTSGDKLLGDRLMLNGGKGLFLKELEEALLQKHADIAVHSMKDVPTELPKGLAINCILKRQSVHDVLISPSHKKLSTLPKGAVIGTASLRRQAQLLAFRQDFIIKPLRGNVGSRLQKLDTGDFDAIVLAKVGLERLNLKSRISEKLNMKIMLPACGQGAIGIECREDDWWIKECLAPLNDEKSATEIECERLVNHLLGGNCHAPIAIYCNTNDQKTFSLRAKIIAPDGSYQVEKTLRSKEGKIRAMASECAEALLKAGGDKILKSASCNL